MTDVSRQKVAPRAEWSVPESPVPLAASAPEADGNTDADDLPGSESPAGDADAWLVTEGPDELLRAILPSPSQLQYERAVITFLESLALWLKAKLHVVCQCSPEPAGFWTGRSLRPGKSRSRISPW